ncbi:MAG TPA: hypothetical protein PK992_19440 [Planctomycetaceae bacterium]|nr:hypothetical protein [Planctomycetaceae bacterium]
MNEDWIEVLIEGDIVKANLLEDLLTEVNELTAILIACVKNAKHRKEQR